MVAEVTKTGDEYKVSVGNKTYSIKLKPGSEPSKLVVEMAHKPLSILLGDVSGQRIELYLEGENIAFQRPSPAANLASQEAPPRSQVNKETLVSPMPGRVITVVVKQGDNVRLGEPLIVIESMKMETAIRSDREGAVEQVLISEGESVRRGQALVKFRG